LRVAVVALEALAKTRIAALGYPLALVPSSSRLARPMPPTNAPRLSACVITINESDRIPAFIESLA
jgi:hypothetical protein